MGGDIVYGIFLNDWETNNYSFFYYKYKLKKEQSFFLYVDI